MWNIQIVLYENVCFHNKNRDDNENDPNGSDADQQTGLFDLWLRN
jgi:hypothetical protein